MIQEESVYRIGQITRTHGVKGEVNFSFSDDVFYRADADYLILDVDGILTPFFLEEYRFRSDTTALLKIIDYDTAEQARELCGCAVYFPHSLTPALGDGEDFTWTHLVGYAVKDATAGLLGKVENVDDSTENVLLTIGRLLIPAVPEFVQRVDHSERVVYIDAPTELLSLNE